MSEVNTLASKVCSFKPEQFHPVVTNTTAMTLEDVFVAPMYSFAWAMNQVLRGIPVSRNIWPVDTYLIPKYDDQKNIIDILQVIRGNTTEPWAISLPDMLHCDWEPSRFMLSFDVKLGNSATDDDSHDWGYMSDKGDFVDGNEHPFGSLVKLTIGKDTNIENVLMFCYRESSEYILLKLSTTNVDSIKALIKKNLTVTVDSNLYNLGVGLYEGYGYSADGITIMYGSTDDSINLGKVLMQQGTKYFGFNWE
ncbi:MAG: hypothetical protein LBI71_00145 [Enterobacteriaceae bacterium]|jgi:hypothetical protein|nr:hypothetical protein [Enterobacteriaceae bacterium]